MFDRDGVLLGLLAQLAQTLAGGDGPLHIPGMARMSLLDLFDTLLSGPVPDQAALHGVLTRIRDLALELLSLRRLDG